MSGNISCSVARKIRLGEQEPKSDEQKRLAVAHVHGCKSCKGHVDASLAASQKRALTAHEAGLAQGAYCPRHPAIYVRYGCMC